MAVDTTKGLARACRMLKARHRLQDAAELLSRANAVSDVSTLTSMADDLFDRSRAVMKEAVRQGLSDSDLNWLVGAMEKSLAKDPK